MEFKYIDDKKEKRQSHEIHIWFEDSFDGQAVDISLYSMGASKEEAIKGAREYVNKAIKKLQDINWEAVKDAPESKPNDN